MVQQILKVDRNVQVVALLSRRRGSTTTLRSASARAHSRRTTATTGSQWSAWSTSRTLRRISAAARGRGSLSGLRPGRSAVATDSAESKRATDAQIDDERTR